jgi:aryl-alcohol dehydrogenase-like predicted oxidoreductase
MYSKPIVNSPIIGATRPHHLEDALAALSVQLTAEEIARLEEPYRPHPVIAHS